MPSSDWDDSWYDDDAFPALRKNRGRGAVVTVAVITFIMCGFNALSASCLSCCGFVFVAFDHGNNGVPLPADFLQQAPVLLIGFGISSGIAFLLQIMAGIGLLNSKRWARTMSFYLAGYSLVTLVFLGYLTANILSNPIGNPDENIVNALISIIGLVFHGGYAAIVLLILLNGRVAASFR